MKNRFLYFIIFLMLGGNLRAETVSSLLYDIDNEKIIYSTNKTKELVPASTIKILTSLIAIEKLGIDYSFITTAKIDSKKNLHIKGYGDPLFISKEVEAFSKKISAVLKTDEINNIYSDQTFFRPLTIYFTGTIKDSIEPYDAPNNALASNFNSLCFETSGKEIFSCENETPLLKEMIPLIRKSQLKKGRIPVNSDNNLNLTYSSRLIKYFLNQNGVKVKGDTLILKGKVPGDDLLVYKSSFRLRDIVEKMLFYSNNFIANQLFLKCGTINNKDFASTEKSIIYYNNYLKEKKIFATIYEGSGISRKNRVSAIEMLKILKRFLPYHKLLKTQDHRNYFKTGTLTGVKNLCGYYFAKNKRRFIYIIFQNNSNKNPFTEFQRLKNIAEKAP